MVVCLYCLLLSTCEVIPEMSTFFKTHRDCLGPNVVMLGYTVKGGPPCSELIPVAKHSTATKSIFAIDCQLPNPNPKKKNKRPSIQSFWQEADFLNQLII